MPITALDQEARPARDDHDLERHQAKSRQGSWLLCWSAPAVVPDTHKRDQQTYDRSGDGNALSEPADCGSQRDHICVSRVEADDLRDAATHPGSSCGFWYRQLEEEIGIAGFDDGLLQVMVVRISGGSTHRTC